MLKRTVIAVMMLLTLNCLPAKDMNDVQTIELPDTITVNQKSDELVSRNLFIEFGGASFGVGIGYDQRFRPNSVFGFRAGLAFTSGTWDDAGWWGAYDGDAYTSVNFKGITLPLEVNAIMGKRASKFELGLGVTPCILDRYEEQHWGWHPEHSGNDVREGVKLNILGTINVGYRLQRKSGFFLRVGMTYLIGDLKCSPIDGVFVMPNLSIGYTIK